MLDAIGGFALTGNLNNSSGVISSQDGTAGDAITISGDYSGGGVVQIDADFENDVADTLTITGNVTGGPTSIQVNNITSDLSLTTGNDLVLVDVTGTTTDGDFRLAGGPISSGAFSYDLELQGTQFALVGMFNVLGAVFEYSSSFFLNQANDNLPTLEQRIGQRVWFDGKNRDEEVRPGKGWWVRFHGNRIEGLNTSGTLYDTRSQHVQLGADLPVEAGPLGQWVFGVSGQFGSASSDILSMGNQGSIHSESYSLGARATWYGTYGTYINTQTHLTLFNTDYATDTDGSLAEDKKATAYGISVEVGQRIPAFGRTTLIPQGQFSVSSVDGRPFVDSLGNDVDLGNNNVMIGRLGLAYEYEYKVNKVAGSLAPLLKVYTIGNVLHDVSGTNIATVGGIDLGARGERTWAEVGGGIGINWGQRATFFSQGSYRTSISSNSRDNKGYAFSFGLRVHW
jgi:outer membrane autotransporter protein